MCDAGPASRSPQPSGVSTAAGLLRVALHCSMHPQQRRIPKAMCMPHWAPSIADAQHFMVQFGMISHPSVHLAVSLSSQPTASGVSVCKYSREFHLTGVWPLEFHPFPHSKQVEILLFLTKYMTSQHIGKPCSDMFSTRPQAMPWIIQPQPTAPHGLQV